ncbi:MAG: DNA-protecting protein DprA [Armatimonadia bacterium]|nr:DNA-protecting protein DprA [Armatimonadia bacterium]
MSDAVEDWLELRAKDRCDLDYWLMLAQLQRTVAIPARVISQVGGAPELFRASGTEISELLGTKPSVLKRMVQIEVNCDLGRERRAFVESGASLVTILADEYPSCLRDLNDPPPCLFVLGDLDLLKSPAISIVGSRSAPESALMDAEDLAARTASQGVTVVSGFALGVDGAAHRGALREGATVAVLGCGIDVLYPSGHESLRADIADRGALVTEMPLGSQPRRWTFPKRNRIIAALGKGTVVIGAREKSGALLTAGWARDLGRPVGAVPGDTRDARHRGALKLLEEGAHLIGSADDVLRMIDMEPGDAKPATPRRRPNLSPHESKVHSALQGDPQQLDDIAAAAGLDVRQASTALMLLEVKGLARRLPGGRFSRLE